MNNYKKFYDTIMKKMRFVTMAAAMLAKVGLDHDATGIIAFFINNRFGSKSVDFMEQGSFTSSESGRASIKVVQKIMT